MELAKKVIKLTKDFAHESRYALLIAIPLMVLQIFTISQLNQLPGPLYGGDIYWHFGETLDIYNGAAPWANHQITGEYAYYGWLTQTLIAYTSKITTINIQAVYMYFPVLLLLATAFASYYLGKEFFGDNKFAALFCLFATSSCYAIAEIWRILGDWTLMMIFLLFLIKSEKTAKIKYTILAGVALGLAGLCHVIAFPAMALFLGVYFLYKVFFAHMHIGFNLGEGKISIKTDESRKQLKEILLQIAPIFAIGFIISLFFFYPIIFIYHGQTPNPVNEYTQPDMKAHGIAAVTELLANKFFNTSGILEMLLSLTLIAGMFFVFRKRRESDIRLIYLLIVSIFLGTFHFLITIPIFGKSLLPGYFFGFLIKVASALLFTLAISEVYKGMQNENYRKIILYSAFGFLIIMASMTVINMYNDQWVSMARDKMNPAILEIASWTQNNTEINDVFLSTEELSFAINGLSARKIMNSRRTHFSPYIDDDQRIADAAVIMYGNNSAKSRELIKKYNITYLYWDSMWIYFSGNDPTLVRIDFEDYLKENGVSYQKVETYLDPAWTANKPKYTVLAIMPASWNQTMPWTKEFNSTLELQKSFIVNGQEYGRIYKIM